MNNIKKWQIAGVVFTIITGTLLHFVYARFGGSFWEIVGAVNESTWEHLKLVFWPMVVFGIAEFLFYGKNTVGFIPIRVTSIIMAMSAVVLLFYTYSGILGRSILIIDILVFILAVISAYAFSCLKLKEPGDFFTMYFISGCEVSVIAVLCVLMFIFTYDPPEIALFQDPITGAYGISR